MAAPRQSKSVVRYAVVGQGYIAQAAVLPAFKHAQRNSRLVALVSGDATKRRSLGKTYGVPAFDYAEYDTLLASGAVDAVYIALPNDQHRDYTVRAARRGVHVLCEKPLAVDERDCRAMIAACKRHRVKLMTAYRLHFERATLSALESVGRGLIGEERLFISSFTMDVEAPNIRLGDPDRGGGTFYDIGIYCINAARHLFRAEPTEVFAATVGGGAARSEESASAILRFPGGRLATFCVSFGTDRTSEYRIIGTKGSLRVEHGYELASGLEIHLTRGGKERRIAYRKRDQFAPELLHFSDCIARDRDPAPSGDEGLADVRVIRALYLSAERGRPVRLAPKRLRKQPTMRQEITRPPVRRMPRLVGATPPGG
ncbi:MAG: Gfo/Idh/MocA family oxidoreductase [Pseudomonadota bacterium]|nr:Gfo/Idh/MocA family oxidoreductase [Pseudomonadota bacterium]